MNIGNISPEVIRQLREKYATGISAPKKVKKAKKAVGKKKTVGRRQGQPVAAKSPSTGRKGINRQAGINLDGFRRLNPSAGINLDVKSPKPVAPKAPKPSTIAKAQSVVPPSNALSGPGITGVEADKRAKAYAKANNIEMDGRTPIFTSEAQRDAMYAAGFRGTGRIVVPEEVQKARLAEARANETPEDRAFRESREAVLKEREENPVPTGKLNPDQYRLLKNEDLMDDDDDFFEDTEGRFGQAGTVYSKDFSESIVDDVSAERAQLKRDAMAANLALGIDEPVGNVRDPNVGSINELFPDAPQAPTPPQLPEVRETYIPSNILGPAFDPKDREAYAAKVQAQREQMQPGGNIQSGGYPTATNPFSAVPQTQFGGYGAQMPMQALNPYAGMARRNPAKTDFFPDYIQRPQPVMQGDGQT